MSVDPDDLEKIEKAVNDGSGQVRALWFAFLGFQTYLAVAAGSVTHRMLLEEAALKLPLLNVELPLVGFFVIAPMSFLVFHFYLLLQMLTLARKVALYNDLLKLQVAHHDDREKVRRRLDLFPIVQVLAGTTEDRAVLNAFLLRTVVVVTTVAGPIAVLLLMQLAFLPYHGSPVTWLHRLIVVLDLVVISLLWPAMQSSEWRIRRFDVRRWIHRTCCAAVILFSLVLASFPGEWNGSLAGPLPEMMLQGPIDDVTGKPVRPFSNVLVLTGEKFADGEKLAKQERSISLRGRDLSGAIFVRADLRKADFTGANLNSAVLSQARLTEAHFGCAEEVDRKAEDIGMFGRFEPIDEKPLFAWPKDRCTWLAGASFTEADLRGADLRRSRAQGANFKGASMQGATLENADLTGALFFGARLEGANLGSADLSGAQLHSARLAGASLAGAHLEGAGIFQADFTAASLREAYVYRTTGAPRSTDLAELATIEFGSSFDAQEFDGEAFEKWLNERLERVPAGPVRERVKLRLTPLDKRIAENKENERYVTRPDVWWEYVSPGPDAEGPVSDALCALACKSIDGLYVARGLIANRRLSAAGERLSALAAHLRNPAGCPGVAGLEEKDLNALAELIDELKPRRRRKVSGFQ